MEYKTGVMELGRKPTPYVSPKEDDEIERWARLKIGRRYQERWLEKRLTKGVIYDTHRQAD